MAWINQGLLITVLYLWTQVAGFQATQTSGTVDNLDFCCCVECSQIRSLVCYTVRLANSLETSTDQKPFLSDVALCHSRWHSSLLYLIFSFLFLFLIGQCSDVSTKIRTRLCRVNGCWNWNWNHKCPIPFLRDKTRHRICSKSNNSDSSLVFLTEYDSYFWWGIKLWKDIPKHTALLRGCIIKLFFKCFVV